MRKLDRLVPPGAGTSNITAWFLSGISLSFIVSLEFLLQLFNELSVINREIDLQGNSEFVMPPYDDMVDFQFFGFVITALIMLVFVFFHYQYFYQGSKSCYVMRRLKNGWEMHLRCWTLPAAYAILSLLSATILYYLYCWIYFIFTPEANLPQQEIQFIWRYLS